MRKLLVAIPILALSACSSLAPPTPAPNQSAPPPAQGQARGAVAAVAPAAPAIAPAAVSAQFAPGQQPVPAGPVGPGLTVLGEASVMADPDVAYVNAGVQTQGTTARQAQDENTAKMTAIIGALKAGGVADADLKTSGLGVQPIYGQTPGQVTGYMAFNHVTATVNDITRAGALLDAAITAGANQSAGVQFGLKNSSDARRRALDEAVKNARGTADAIAGAAGVRIVAIQALSDEGGGVPGPIPYGVAASAPQAQLRADVPVQPGQLNVTARVRVVYTIAQ